MTTVHRLRSLFRVVLPVLVAALLVLLAIVNIAQVKTYQGESEDGVLWTQGGANVIARAVAPKSAGERAGIQAGDVLVTADGSEVANVAQIISKLHTTPHGRTVRYVIARQSVNLPLTIDVQPIPLGRRGLYYSMALVGLLAIAVGASVRLRRPADRATLHYFWLTVAFTCALAITPSGRYDALDYFFDWADLLGRLLLPPLFLHFAFVF